MDTNEPNGTNARRASSDANTNRDAAFVRLVSELWAWGKRLKRPIKRAELRRKIGSSRVIKQLEATGILKASGEGFLIDDKIVKQIKRNTGSF